MGQKAVLRPDQFGTLVQVGSGSCSPDDIMIPSFSFQDTILDSTKQMINLKMLYFKFIVKQSNHHS